jgi:hypothetical protein
MTSWSDDQKTLIQRLEYNVEGWQRLRRVISWEKSGNFGRCKELKNVIGDFVLLSVSGLWFQEGTERVS